MVSFRFSDISTEHLITRYYSQTNEGLCYINLNDNLKEKLQVMKTLAIVGSPSIPRFNSITAHLEDDTALIYFLPNQQPKLLSGEQAFLKGFYSDTMFWYLTQFNANKIEAIEQIPIESTIIEVDSEYLWLRSFSYDNKYFLSNVFIKKIKLSDIIL